MTQQDQELLIETLETMMDGHFEIMRALFRLKTHIEKNTTQTPPYCKSCGQPHP